MQAVVLWEYQEQAVVCALQRRSVVVRASAGSGKTLVCVDVCGWIYVYVCICGNEMTMCVLDVLCVMDVVMR